MMKQKLWLAVVLFFLVVSWSTQALSQTMRDAVNHHNRSRNYHDRGDSERAIEEIQKALAIVEKLKGKNDPVVGLLLNDLSYYYRAAGQPEKVEPLLKRALAINEKAHGKNHLSVAGSVKNLAFFYRDQGLFKKAEPLFKRQVAILAKVRGKDHIQTAGAMLALGGLYGDMKRHRDAEAQMKKGLAIAEKTGDALTIGPYLNNLALVYKRSGKFKEAEAAYKRNLKALAPRMDPQAQDFLIVQGNLGMLYVRQGRFEEARPLLETVRKASFEKGLRGERSDVYTGAHNLAELYWGLGEMRRAAMLWREAYEIQSRNEAMGLSFGSEAQRLAFAASGISNLHATVSMNVLSSPTMVETKKLAMLTVLRTKGMVLEAQSRTYQDLRRSLDKATIQELGQLARINSERAGLSIGARNKATQERIDALEKDAEDLQKILAAQNASAVRKLEVVTLDMVRAKIPRTAALVEMIKYLPYKPGTSKAGQWRYAAWVMTFKGAIRAVDLGEAKSLEADVASFRSKLVKREPVEALAKALHKRLVAPLLPHTDGAKHILLSPDGALLLLPFDALQDETGKHLLETHTLTYLTTGRELLRFDKPAKSRGKPVVVGNPTYNKATGATSKEAALRSSSMGRMKWSPLPGTAEEIKAISGLLPGARLLGQDKATEGALKGLKGPRILHLATHGFFLQGQDLDVKGTRGFVNKGAVSLQTEQAAEVMKGWENPLLRSGIVLAGANKPAKVGEDGYLTALEASSLDLVGTQLVVMSACETGVGQVENGRGVYGLRRAMALAGTESQVMSLWQVADDATKALMIEYYKRLTKGEGRSEALRGARLAVLADEKWKHPFFWAAFIPSGNWKPLRAR